MRFSFYGLAVLAVSLLLAGCSSNEEKKALEPLPLTKIEEKASLEKLWSGNVGKGQPKNVFTKFQLAVEEESIYAMDLEGTVFAFDLSNGKKRWQKKLDMAVSGGVSVKAGQVYLASYDGDIVALSADDGSELWRAEVSSEVLGPPQSNGSHLAVTSINGSLTVFDAKSGVLLWTYGHVTPTLSLRGLASPVLTATQVIAAFDNGQVLAFNANDGASLWEMRVAQPTGRHDLERLIDIDGTPLIQGGVIYVSAYQGAVAAIARAQGRILWKQDVSSSLPLAFGSRKIFLSDEDGRLVAYNANAGSQEWENKELLRRGVGAPAVLGAYLAVMDDESYLHLLSQGDGSLVGRTKVSGKRFRSPMLSYDNKLFILSGDGKLSAYALKP